MSELLPLVLAATAANFRRAVDRAMRGEAEPGEVDAARSAVFDTYDADNHDPGVHSRLPYEG